MLVRSDALKGGALTKPLYKFAQVIQASLVQETLRVGCPIAPNAGQP